MKLITIFLCLLLVVGCSTNNDKANNISEENDLKIEYSYECLNAFDFLHKLNVRNKSRIEHPNYDNLDEFAPKDAIFEGLVSEQEFSDLLSLKRDEKMYVKSSELLEDIDLMFRLFKASYGAYYYIGERKFIDAENELLKWAKENSAYGIDSVKTKFAQTFEFLRDRHVFVGVPAKDRNGFVYYSYILDNQYFNKDDVGYYKEENGTKWYFKAIDNQEITMELFLNNDGELVYSPVCLSNIELNSANLTLTSENNKQRIETINWIKNTELNPIDNYNPDFKYLCADDIVYISLRHCPNINEFDKYDEFIKSAKDAKNSRLIIFDIRSNSGGTDQAIVNWMSTYTELKNIRDYFSNYGLNRISELSIVTGMSEGLLGYHTISTNAQQIKNETPIVILTDSGCGSNGEALQIFLNTLENSVVIGSNTGGAQICGNQISMRLPNSGIELKFGINMHFAYETKNIDGIGYKPDIFTNVKNGLDVVAKHLVNTNFISEDEALKLLDDIEKLYDDDLNQFAYAYANAVYINGYGHEIYPGDIGDIPNFGAGMRNESFEFYSNGAVTDNFEVESLSKGLNATKIDGKINLSFNNDVEDNNYFKVIHDGREYIFAYAYYH